MKRSEKKKEEKGSIHSKKTRAARLDNTIPAKKGKPEEGDQKPTWKKVTRGSLYPFVSKRNKRVKPDEMIQATEDEIKHVRNHFQLIKDGTGAFKVKAIVPGVPAAASTPAVKETYTVVAHPEEEDMYNVVSSSGKVMNTEALDLDDAEGLKENLEEETEED